MATRMQQRKGTASQWTSANPILNAAEMGWESDTNKFKIGDGINHWADLDYFIDANSTVNPSFGSSIVFEGATANDFETTLAITDPTADRTITFPDATGTVALTSDISELSQDAIDSALTAGTGITKTYNDGANTLTLAVDTTTIQARVADVSDTEIGYLNGVTSAIQTQIDSKSATGHGHTASNISDFDTQVRTNRLDQMAAPTGSVSLNSQKITNLATPTDNTDAATKSYVDAVTEGLHIHPSVVAATTANVALSTALENGDTLDGITLATNDRILVKNQTTTSENGIYVVQASGQPVRATDFDTAAEVDSGDFVFVSSGTVNGSTGWVQTNKPATIGTDPIAFTQFSGAGTYTAGNGLTLTGNSFSINTSITQARVSGVSDTEIGYLDGVTSGIQTQLDAKIAKADITAKGVILVGTGAGTYSAQSVGTNGQVLTANSAQADGVEWTTVSSYSAPTLGSTSIASGATVTTIAGLTLTAPTLTGTVTASGDINLSAAGGPGSVIDELTLLLMGAI